MRSECEVGAADIKRVMAAYYARMDPTQSPRSCGSCGVMDIPIDEALHGAPRASDVGVESFREVRLDDPIITSLLYTDAPVPSNVPGRDFAWPGRAGAACWTGILSHPTDQQVLLLAQVQGLDPVDDWSPSPRVPSSPE